ncbi:hypothetical protein LIER_33637 [Lithospermum erythrorhizon]|uniref:RNase H type-1 domain-containing protein n=1 Tax=Lithospermum erythrorhizon TaxID=34254 RepID=A0AAV3S111_LITER
MEREATIQAGKEVMIKSVTSAIPIFVMIYFKLPVGIIDKSVTFCGRVYMIMVYDSLDTHDHHRTVAIIQGVVRFCYTEVVLLMDQEAGRPELLSSIACMLWSLWKTTNNKMFEGAHALLDNTIKYGLQLILDFERATNKASSDGAIRVIGRDSVGNFVGASYKRLQWVSSPLVAEAHALREGLQFAWRLNWHSVELESDSKQLVQILKGEQMTPNGSGSGSDSKGHFIFDEFDGGQISVRQASDQHGSSYGRPLGT